MTEPDHEHRHGSDTDAEVEEASGTNKVPENKQNEVADNNSDVPEIAVSPPSPSRPEHKDGNKMPNNISSKLHNNSLDQTGTGTLENNDENLEDEEDLGDDSGGTGSMPMIKITIESPVESLSSPSESPNEHKQEQHSELKFRKKSIFVGQKDIS